MCVQYYGDHMRATPSSYLDAFNMGGGHGPFDGTGFPKSPEDSSTNQNWAANPMAAAAAYYGFPPSTASSVANYERMMTPSFGAFGAFPPQAAAAAAHPHNPFPKLPWGNEQSADATHGHQNHAPTPPNLQGGDMRMETMV